MRINYTALIGKVFLTTPYHYSSLQLISYKRYLECTLIQWTLSFGLREQVAVGTFFIKSPALNEYYSEN